MDPFKRMYYKENLLWKKIMEIGLCLLILFWQGCQNQENASESQTKNQSKERKTGETPAQQEKKTAVPSHKKEREQTPKKTRRQSIHWEKWQSLIKGFYDAECDIKEGLKPFYSHEIERTILKTYLPSLCTASFYEYSMGFFEEKMGKVDPAFPVGPVDILKIESESESKAILIVSVRTQKKKAMAVGRVVYRLNLVQEEGQWKIAKEEEIQEISGVTSATPRNVFGHMRILPDIQAEIPLIESQTPEKVWQSLVQIIRYLQKERNRQASQILPPLFPKIQPFVSKEYYRLLVEERNRPSTEICMKILQFQKTEIPPELEFPPESDSLCYWLAISTFKMPGEEPFRPYEYYWILKKEKGWKIDLEIGKRIDKYPTPLPLLYNLLYWQIVY